MLDNQILFDKSSQINMRRLKKKFNFLTIFWLFKNWDASISQRNWNKKVLMLKTRVRWPKFIIQTKKKHFGNNLNLTKMTPSWGTVGGGGRHGQESWISRNLEKYWPRSLPLARKNWIFILFLFSIFKILKKKFSFSSRFMRIWNINLVLFSI